MYKKRGDAPRQSNIALKARFFDNFSRKVSIFGRFWVPRGTKLGSKIDPKTTK